MNEEDEDKIEKMDKMLAMAGEPVLETISTNLKAFFMFSTLLLKATL